MTRLWWASFLRSALGAAIIIGALCALASVIEIYFFAVVFLVLIVLYRREVLGRGGRDARITGFPGASGGGRWP